MSIKSVPPSYTNYMQNMDIDYYMDKYYPRMFNEYKYNKHVEKGINKDKCHYQYWTRGVGYVTIKNRYDNRMRPTNLYVSWLEHKIYYLELKKK